MEKTTKPSRAELELADVNSKLEAAENLALLHQKRFLLSEGVDALKEQVSFNSAAHENAVLQEKAITAHKESAGKHLTDLTVSLERLRVINRAENVQGLVASLNSWGDAIEGVEFFIDSHADKVAHHKRATVAAKSAKSRAEGELSDKKKELASVESSIAAVTPETAA